MKILLPIILFFISQNLFSQNKKVDSTYKVPFDTNKIKEAVRLSNTSEVFSYDSLYIWSDKRSLSEIMNERQGYFVFDFGLGGRNDINYNSRSYETVGIFKDGIQINDNYFQGFDIQNISVNEIDKIEEVSSISSFFYGINSSAKSINVITKDYFNPKPFSQLRFSQDRYSSLFADVIFSQPFSRKASIQLGLTKHSLDGRYTNSEFDIWRARGRLNFFLSPKLNAKLNFYFNKYDRGLNNGLVYSSDKDSLIDPKLAKVEFATTKENLKNYYYDLTFTSKLFKNKNSLTKVKLYSSNLLRHVFFPGGLFFINNNYSSIYNHNLQYGLDLEQSFNLKFLNLINSELIMGGNIYYNIFESNVFKKYKEQYYSLKAKYNLNYKNFFITVSMRNDNIKNKNFLNLGAELNFEVLKSDNSILSLYIGLNRIKYYIVNESFYRADPHFNFNSLIDIPRNNYEAGINAGYGKFNLEIYLYKHNWDNTIDNTYGSNTSLSFNSRNLDLSFIYNYSNESLFPQYYLKSNMTYKNILFKDKLNLKIGFDMKYYRINYIIRQDQFWYSWNYTNTPFSQKNQFIADFYIGARIGHANVNLTIANIFNSLVYNTYLFPLDDRGGFLNSISRFTIVWDFIN